MTYGLLPGCRGPSCRYAAGADISRVRPQLLRGRPGLRAELAQTAWRLALGLVLLAMRYERFDGRLERIRAPDLLKLSRNLAVAAPGIIAALAADQLVHPGAAVIRPAAEDTGGPLPEAERPFSTRQLTHRHVRLSRNGVRAGKPKRDAGHGARWSTEPS